MQLEIGQPLKNGYILDANFRNRIVLAHCPDLDPLPVFVVWEIDRNGKTAHGRFHGSFEAAFDTFTDMCRSLSYKPWTKDQLMQSFKKLVASYPPPKEIQIDYGEEFSLITKRCFVTKFGIAHGDYYYSFKGYESLIGTWVILDIQSSALTIYTSNGELIERVGLDILNSNLRASYYSTDRPCIQITPQAIEPVKVNKLIEEIEDYSRESFPDHTSQ